jgi:hypothetical protein
MSKKFSDDFLKNQTIASVIGIISFFLPWFSIEIFGSLSISGYDLLPDEGFSFLYFFPLGFAANIVLVNLKKENLMYLRGLIFTIPFVVGLIKFKDIFSLFNDFGASDIFAAIIPELINVLSYGFYITLICIIYIYFTPTRVTDVNDPDFGEI